MTLRTRFGARALALLSAAALQGGIAAQVPRTDEEAVERARLRRGEVSAARETARGLAAARLGVARARAIRLQPGDLLTATSRRSSALRLQLDEDKTRIRRHALDADFVPRAIDYESAGAVAAIAAVSKVLLLYTATGEVTVLDGPGSLAPGFGFVNDVLFIDANTLLIADLGEVTGGKLPTDGHVWRYDTIAGTFDEAATGRAFSNPSHLARGPLGEVYLVDTEGGPKITPIFEFYYDHLYELAGQQLLNARSVFDDPGLQATAFDVGADGRFWFASLAEILLLQEGVLSYPCGLSLPFEYVTSVLVVGSEQALLLDGAGDPPRRTLYQVDPLCAATIVSANNKLKESRGLVQVPETS